jgi:16S rRNA (guanine527-N7)-methyltransferase
VNTDRIAELLQPFIGPESLRLPQLQSISTYIDILLRWNARINLTAIREPEEIVTRHFGESLFSARHLFPGGVGPGLRSGEAGQGSDEGIDLIDLGSGAGFPGLPIKLWVPDLRITLIESNQKKSTFLREVTRALTLMNVDVVSARAEDFPTPASVVTLRAVERLEDVLPTAARLVSPGGRLSLLIGNSRAAEVPIKLPHVKWLAPVPIPASSNRVLLIGTIPGSSDE